MKNLEIAQIFREMADMLDILDIPWKPRAYRRAAQSIETLSEDIESIFKKGGLDALEEIPGIGKGIRKKIVQYLTKGKINEFEKLKNKIPKGLRDIIEIQGMGPKKAKILYKKLKIKNVKDLARAARQGRIEKLRGFGRKSEEDILKGVEIYQKGKERMLLGQALPIAREIRSFLNKQSGVKGAVIAGSLRRMRETVGDIDILVVSSTAKNAKLVMSTFTKMSDVAKIIAKGPTKSSVMLKNGLQADLRVLDEKSFGSALQYFTGSRSHNIKLREIAIKKGFKLSEYGLFSKKTGRYVCGRTEKEIYNKLGMGYVEPELRENLGEIQAAQKKNLPKLIPYGSIKGDLHFHTKWSDGNDTIEQVGAAAKRYGYEYISISDHSKTNRIYPGLDEKDLLKQFKEIERLNKKIKGIKILKSSEVDISADGSLSLSNSILKKMDIVIASIHSRFKSPKKEMTKRILKAMDNRYVNILAHPTGRLINQRPAYEIDKEKIFEAAKSNNIALEINSSPVRLDLNDSDTKLALEHKCRFVINTDGHSSDNMHFIEYGIAQARRAWCTKKHVLNTLPLKKLLKELKK